MASQAGSRERCVNAAGVVYGGQFAAAAVGAFCGCSWPGHRKMPHRLQIVRRIIANGLEPAATPFRAIAQVSKSVCLATGQVPDSRKPRGMLYKYIIMRLRTHRNALRISLRAIKCEVIGSASASQF